MNETKQIVDKLRLDAIHSMVPGIYGYSEITINGHLFAVKVIETTTLEGRLHSTWYVNDKRTSRENVERIIALHSKL